MKSKKTEKNVVKKQVKQEEKTNTCACCASDTKCCCDKKDCLYKIGIVSAIVLALAGLVFGNKGCDCDEAKMNQSVEQYIKKNPKVILDTIDAHLREQEEQARKNPPAPQVAPAGMVEEIVNDKTNMVLGNPEGKFVIIEFFDYQCGWCKKTNAEISAVLKDAPNIRWILIDTPIFGASSELISQYALAAAKQNKFKEMHEAIGNAKGKLDETALIELAQGLKLDVEKIKKDAHSDEIKQKLSKNKEYTRTLKIGGVPMLIVDGKLNPGALIGDRLQNAVKASNEK